MNHTTLETIMIILLAHPELFFSFYSWLSVAHQFLFQYWFCSRTTNHVALNAECGIFSSPLKVSFLSYVFIRFLKDGLFFVLIKRRKERRKVGRRVSYKTKYEQRTHRKGKTSTRMRGRLNLDWSQIFTQSSSLYLTN